MSAPPAGPRWLWISAELPAERSTGRLVYSASLIDSLADRGVGLTVVGLGPEPTPRPGVDWVAAERDDRPGWRSLVSTLPNLAFACSGPHMRTAVADAIDDGPWDAVVIDHLQAAWATSIVRERHRGPVVFVTHNHEATVRRAVARDSSWRSGRRAVLSVDAWKAARLESETAGRCDVLTAITADDLEAFAAEGHTALGVLLPPGWSGARDVVASPMSSRPRRVGVLGSFEWHVKQENLRRFVAEAGHVLADADIELVVGGRAPEGFQREVGALAPIRFLGFVDDPAAFLDTCRVGLVAEPMGGGFKMKILDYVFHDVVVAATAGSVAGLPVGAEGDMLTAETSIDLARRIVASVDDADALARSATANRSRFDEEFRWERRAEALADAVTEVRR